MHLRNKTTSEFRTVFLSPLSIPNSQNSLYMASLCYRVHGIVNLTRLLEWRLQYHFVGGRGKGLVVVLVSKRISCRHI